MLLSLMLSFTVQGSEVQETASPMMDLSNAFMKLDKALDSENVNDSELWSEALSTAALNIETVGPSRNQRRTSEFHQMSEHLQALASGIRSEVAKGDLSSARFALEDVRHACVYCHVLFRSHDQHPGAYPAKNNTLFGTIDLTALDGSKVDERANIVAFIDGFGRTQSGAGRRAKVSQEGIQFSPEVLVVQEGTVVDFPNDDKVFHNVFSLSKAKPFDLDIYSKGESRSVEFDKSGLISIHCNLHPQMSCHILVLNNSLYSKTNDEGEFLITGIPDGEFALRTWHRLGGNVVQTMSFEGGRLHTLTLPMIEEHRTIQHTNKFGKPYRGKYR